MKLAILPVFGLVACTLATPLPGAVEARQIGKVDIFHYHAGKVEDSVKDLINVLTPGPGRDENSAKRYFTDALNSNKRVIDSLRAGANEVKHSKDTINQLQAIDLSTHISQISSKLASAPNYWISAKRAAVYVGADNAILDAMTLLQGDAIIFIDAYLNKENFVNQALGSPWKTGIQTAYSKAIAEYRK